jgi:hypothetical protein
MSCAPGWWPALSQCAELFTLTRYPALIECMSKRNFQFRRLRPILKVPVRSAEHAAASTLIEPIAPCRSLATREAL